MNLLFDNYILLKKCFLEQILIYFVADHFNIIVFTEHTFYKLKLMYSILIQPFMKSVLCNKDFAALRLLYESLMIIPILEILRKVWVPNTLGTRDH